MTKASTGNTFTAVQLHSMHVTENFASLQVSLKNISKALYACVRHIKSQSPQGRYISAVDTDQRRVSRSRCAWQASVGSQTRMAEQSQQEDFSFPVPRPPKQSQLPKQNPLTSRATVVDCSDRQNGAQVPKSIPIPEPKLKPDFRPGKIPLEKGYSQMDWMRLTRTHPDLAGLSGKPNNRPITMAEVKQHRSKDDAWLVLKGKVYNVTPYLKFHPGGLDWIMKGAGLDATFLFNKYHAWVNSDFMLEKCVLGYLAAAAPETKQA